MHRPRLKASLGYRSSLSVMRPLAKRLASEQQSPPHRPHRDCYCQSLAFPVQMAGLAGGGRSLHDLAWLALRDAARGSAHRTRPADSQLLLLIRPRVQPCRPLEPALSQAACAQESREVCHSFCSTGLELYVDFATPGLPAKVHRLHHLPPWNPVFLGLNRLVSQSRQHRADLVLEVQKVSVHRRRWLVSDRSMSIQDRERTSSCQLWQAPRALQLVTIQAELRPSGNHRTRQ